MNKRDRTVTAMLTVLSLLTAASAPAATCKRAEGELATVLVPSNDPLGRTLGTVSARLHGAVTTYLTTLSPLADGSLAATANGVFATSGGLVEFSELTTYTPLAGQPIGTVRINGTLTVVGGTGPYAGVTGSLQVTGIGTNLFGPAAGPGSTRFDMNYAGALCLP
jgi:hypothetical protein